MKKIINHVGIVFFVAVLVSGCLLNKESTTNAAVYEKKYSCDSIIVYTNNFSFEDDSAVYSPIRKEPFKYKIQISRDYIEQNGIKYYYLLSGINIDTIGLISITEQSYLYKTELDDKNNVFLFRFDEKINSVWEIKEEGFFNHYRVVLNDIVYNETTNDSLYFFNYYFSGQKLPNGYYFEYFVVSKQYGIMSFGLSNGIKCNCLGTE